MLIRVESASLTRWIDPRGPKLATCWVVDIVPLANVSWIGRSSWTMGMSRLFIVAKLAIEMSAPLSDIPVIVVWSAAQHIDSSEESVGDRW